MENELKIILSGDASQLEAATNKANKALNGVKQSSANASYALTNLSRVAQDAPFGFIAIQNNLSPLLDSFTALKQQTGTVGGALSALGSSLIGPAGIGFAFSAVSSIITYFALNSRGAGDASKKAADDIKSSFDIIQSAAAGVEGESAKVRALSSVVTDLSKSYNERNGALKQLKKINENYFGDLTLEASGIGKVKKAVEEYTQAIVAQAVVKGFESEISKVSQELFKQREEFIKVSKEVSFYEEATKKAAATGNKNANNISYTNSQYEAYSNLLLATKKRQDDVATSLKNTAVTYENLNKGIQDAVNESLKFKALDKDKPQANDKVITGRTIELKAIKATTVALTEMGQARRNALIMPEGPQQVLDNYTNSLASQRDILKDISNTQQLIGDQLGANAEKNKSLFDMTKMKEYSDFIINTLTPAFSSAFDAILSGSQNAFQAFGQAILGVIKKLVVAAATAALVAIAISFIPGVGAAGATSGARIGANFASIFSQLSGLPKFADGGIVSGPTRALIGEAGPEAVIPLSKLNSIIGGNSNVFVTGVLSGETIFLQQQRTEARRQRFV